MGRRIMAGFIDFSILQLMMIFYVILSVEITVIDKMLENELYNFLGFLLMLIGGFIYLILKDLVFRNKSIRKKIMGLHIISDSTKTQPTKRTIMIRNLTWIMFSIDLIIFLIKGKRLGEIITNTKVVPVK
jgi:uncharacterized RDD family membrane protein YckC